MADWQFWAFFYLNLIVKCSWVQWLFECQLNSSIGQIIATFNFNQMVCLGKTIAYPAWQTGNSELFFDLNLIVKCEEFRACLNKTEKTIYYISQQWVWNLESHLNFTLQKYSYLVRDSLNSSKLLKTSNLTLKSKQFCTPIEGNLENVLLTSRVRLKYFYQWGCFFSNLPIFLSWRNVNWKTHPSINYSKGLQMKLQTYFDWLKYW